MSAFGHWLIALLLLLPLMGGVAVLLVRRAGPVRWIAIAMTAACLFAALLAIVPLRWNSSAVLSRAVAIDGLSLPLIVFTTFIFVVACATSWREAVHQPLYLSLLLFLEFTLLGTLLSLSLVSLCVFSALTLLPAGLLIGRWGAPGADRAVFWMCVVLGIGVACLLIAACAGSAITRNTLLVLLVISCMVRLPLFPLHGWLLGVLSEAQVPIAMIIAAVLPITGGYALFRFAAPLFIQGGISLWWVWAAIALAGIFYGGLCAMGEDHLPQLLAYAVSSLGGFVLLGVAIRTATGADGAILLLLGNGSITAALLLNRSPRAGASESSAFHIALLATAWIVWLVVPVLVAELMVLFGTFQTTRPDSMLRTGGASVAAIDFITIGCCLGIVLQGIWATRFLYGQFSLPAGSGPSATDNRTGQGASVALGIVVILLGILPGPLCFIFTHQALVAILHGG